MDNTTAIRKIVVKAKGNAVEEEVDLADIFAGDLPYYADGTTALHIIPDYSGQIAGVRYVTLRQDWIDHPEMLSAIAVILVDDRPFWRADLSKILTELRIGGVQQVYVCYDGSLTHTYRLVDEGTELSGFYPAFDDPFNSCDTVLGHIVLSLHHGLKLGFRPCGDCGAPMTHIGRQDPGDLYECVENPKCELKLEILYD